jgi:hypothetical protein
MGAFRDLAIGSFFLKTKKDESIAVRRTKELMGSISNSNVK